MIDGLGKKDGVLREQEIARVLAMVRQMGVGYDGLRTGFAKLLGNDFLAEVRTPADVNERVGTELGARAIDDADLRRELWALCKDPVLSVREASTPAYSRAAEWVARELSKHGVVPLGDGVEGGKTFFQAFRYEDRYAKDPNGRPQISRSSNVVGYLPGTGKVPREAVVVVAHLDNLSHAEKDWYRRTEGEDLTHYEGANDNAAAVAALLEIADGLRAAGPSTRDVIFFVPSAEEDGLKGTEAFMLAPPVPLDRVVGVVNLEMIGRNATSELLLYGGESENEAKLNPLYGRAEKVAAQAGIQVKPGPANDDGEGWYRRSDHLIFANAGIPAIMFHGRTASGNYHTADDTLENLNLEKVRVTGQLALRVVRDLANDADAKEKRGTPRPTLNTYPGRVWPGG